jgi:shikimate 5-dehydrogenase
VTIVDASIALPLPVLTVDALVPAERATYYFLGVSTGSSSIQRVFPRWAERLGLGDAVLRGIDLPVGSSLADTRRIVEFVAGDPHGVGMQITSHKIAVSQSARDRFDELKPLATLMGEVSCVTKHDGRLSGYAKDPVAGALALDALVPHGHWTSTGAEALIMGAGGAGTALTWCLVRDELGQDRPTALTVTDRDPVRLQHLGEIAKQVGASVPLRLVHVPDAAATGEVLAGLPAGSLVVNATGLGKDLPGSPIDDAAVFPLGALAWDLNYRGDLTFLDQARAQQSDRGLVVEDGWNYFLHGWLQAIKQVFAVDVPTEGPEFQALSELAQDAR